MQGVAALPNRDAVASLIGWWREAGVDTLVDDAPRNWLAKALPPAPRPDPVAQKGDLHAFRPALQDNPGGGQTIDLPDTLAGLLEWMRDGDDVPEAKWGRKRILPAGDPASGLMILTDMPEPGDAEAGILLSGEIGALFDRMLAAIGRGRDSIWLAPLASIRSVGRVPQDASDRLIAIARHQIGLVAPKRLLIMGEQPNKALIGPDWQARRGEIQALDLGHIVVETVSTFHPRLLHDRPAYKKQAWSDLQLLTKGL